MNFENGISGKSASDKIDSEKGSSGKSTEMKHENYQLSEINGKVLILGFFLCLLASASIPYVTLKLGQSVDLTMGGMFLAALFLGKKAMGRELAVQLNVIQTMITSVSGIAFMVVILSAFFYIQTVFNRDIGFNPTFWQMFIWLVVSANLGVFMGVIPRKTVLKDKTLPWPISRAILSVAETLSDDRVSKMTAVRRNVLTVATGVTGFFTFMRDSFGVLPAVVGNAALNISFGFEFAAIGLGMLVPLTVGLSYFLGVWFVQAFGDTVSKYSALSGVSEEHFNVCLGHLNNIGNLTGSDKTAALDFLTANCGKAVDFVNSTSHFKYIVQWMMWPATAMMIAAALTSVLIPMIKNTMLKRKLSASGQPIEDEEISLADEKIPTWWNVAGIGSSALLLIWLTSTWFEVPWYQVLLAFAIQPFLIVAGLKVLGVTGSGPVSLMANATQFLFGLIWPAHIKSNLTAAYVSANPQSASENSMPSFWVAQRIGGNFRTLVLAQLIVVPIGAALTPFMFLILEKTYGIGLNPGQLAAPTGLKIATLAIVMEKGLSYLPKGALIASLVGIGAGILFEILSSFYKTDENGVSKKIFWMIPNPSAFGFALILPSTLSIGMGLGSVISAAWKKFSPEKDGSYDLFAAPLASGLIAGEAMVGSILIPALSLLMEFLK